MCDDRESRRIETDAELVVYRGGQPAAVGRVRNVSHDGLFLSADRLELNWNDPVELEYRSLGGTRTYRFAAQVVHRSDNGAGLFVERDDRRAAEGIRALMGLQPRTHH